MYIMCFICFTISGLCCLAQRNMSSMSTVDHVFFSARCFFQFVPCSHTLIFTSNTSHQQLISQCCHMTASLLKTYISSKGVTTKYFSQLKSQRLTRGVMKHLISVVEIQKRHGWESWPSEASLPPTHREQRVQHAESEKKHSDIMVQSRKTPQIMLRGK